MSDTFDLHAIPTTLQDLLMARLDRLDSNPEIVQLAAAIGREFSYELLSAAASCSEEALQEELAKLVDAELLFARGRPPIAGYQFKHALIRDAAYQSLLKKKRQQFHMRIAEVLEQRFPETCATQPELVAHHFTEGNLPPKAVKYWARAGECAQQRGAVVEAEGHFNRSLVLVRTLPESRERNATEIQLHIGLGVALAATRGTGATEVEATFARAHSLCLQTGLTAELGPVLFGRLRHCMNRAMHGKALELAEELLQFARQGANPGFLVCAHCALGVSLVSQGRHAEALLHLEEVIGVEAIDKLRLTVNRYCLIDPWVTAHSFLSWALWYLGFPERAAQHSQQAVNDSESLGHALSLGFALTNASWLQQLSRETEGARATAARALALGTEKCFAGIIAPARVLCGWSLAGIEQTEQTVRAIRQGLDELQAQGAISDRCDLLILLAEACARTGRPKEGMEALAEAQKFADATGQRLWEPELHRLKGELLLQHDPMAAQDAETYFHQAMKLARTQQARSLELRAAMSLARLWCQQGKSKKAGELLAPVYASFTEGFQTYDLQMARVLLEQCQSERA
jgi:predicted ATPase